MPPVTQKLADECAPTGRPSGATCAQRQPEIHDPELLAIATRIATKVLTLSPVAATAGELMIDRLVLGHERYGAPDLDGRDWEWERDQETLDRANYVELIEVAQRHRTRQRASSVSIDLGINGVVRIPAPPFDTSDVEDESIESAVVAHVEAGR